MTIILDFDETLFDTTRFKEALAGIFRKYKADFWRTYEEAKKLKGVYSLKNHLALIQKVDIKRIKEDIDKINFKKFLFPDVMKFLKTFRKDNSLILLSWGEKSFHEKKIYGVGPAFISLFNEIITGPTEKAKVLRGILKLYKSRPVVFIDNSSQELKKIKDNFKDVILIKINRNKRESLFKVWRANKINQ